MSDPRTDDREVTAEAVRQALEAGNAAAVVDSPSDKVHACFREACRNGAFLSITLRGRIHTSEPSYRCVDHWTPIRCLLTDLGYSIIYTEEALDLLWEELGCPTWRGYF